MDLTRRQFLGCAAASAVLGRLEGPPLDNAGSRGDGAVLLTEHCVNAEAAAGYKATLATLNCGERSVVVVPAALDISPATIRLLRGRLAGGATVILESGAGFAPVNSCAFLNHLVQVRDDFGIHIDPPRALWPARSVPYVHYLWPRAAAVRDFSCIVPLVRGQADIIARVNGIPAALARRWHNGTFIFLGSPLGPALLFGDLQAKDWLRDVLLH